MRAENIFFFCFNFFVTVVGVVTHYVAQVDLELMLFLPVSARVTWQMSLCQNQREEYSAKVLRDWGLSGPS